MFTWTTKTEVRPLTTNEKMKPRCRQAAKALEAARATLFAKGRALDLVTEDGLTVRDQIDFAINLLTTEPELITKREIK